MYDQDILKATSANTMNENQKQPINGIQVAKTSDYF